MGKEKTKTPRISKRRVSQVSQQPPEKHSLCAQLCHLGCEVQGFALPLGYSDLFEVAEKVLKFIVQIVEIRRVFRHVKDGTVGSDSKESVVQLMNVTRNAIYHRIKQLGCKVEDFRDGKDLDDLLNPNAKLADIIDELREACREHDFTPHTAWPAIERGRQVRVKKSPLADNKDDRGEPEFVLIGESGLR